MQMTLDEEKDALYKRLLKFEGRKIDEHLRQEMSDEIVDFYIEVFAAERDA